MTKGSPTIQDSPKCLQRRSESIISIHASGLSLRASVQVMLAPHWLCPPASRTMCRLRGACMTPMRDGCSRRGMCTAGGAW